MYKLKRKLLSQNFLHSRRLVNELVRGSSLGQNDLVLEVGPGKGIITEALVAQAQRVIAVEHDSRWYHYLHQKFAQTPNLILYNQNFLTFV